MLAVQTQQGEWAPGIADPTPLGWIPVGAYCVAAWLCARAALRSRGGDRRLTIAWRCFAGLMIALGINKQLDLQTLLTIVGRRWAMHGGWYERRRRVQLRFIEGMVLSGLLTLAAGAWLMQRHLVTLRCIRRR